MKENKLLKACEYLVNKQTLELKQELLKLLKEVENVNA